MCCSAFAQESPQRVERGLVCRYEFNEDGGRVIRDSSGVGEPLDLTIDKPGAVRWVDGALLVESPVALVTSQPAKKLIDAIKRSGALTIEVWLKPASVSQEGPARIVSLSADTSQRNVTLGQDKDLYDVRLRATTRDRNGLPSTSTPKKSLQTRLTHVVFTRDASGSAVLYLDGKQVAAKRVEGNFSNWDAGHRLSLANEVTGDRPWRGELHLVALYDRALSIGEVRQNLASGASGKSTPLADGGGQTGGVAATTFEVEIAPLLAQHCLECHDSAIRKGGLDLSKKTAALAGGDSGKAITPGKSADSLLWEMVAADEMPKDRAALSSDEKSLIKTWLDAGAGWPIDAIDPANYTHADRSQQVWVQRLTAPEYIETVRSSLGVDIAKEAREILPPDVRADGFSNTAYNLSVDLKHVEAYGKLAEIIVSRLDVARFAGRFSKSRQFNDDKMRDFIAAMGKWLLRGPLDEYEINLYRGIASKVSSAGGDYDDAVAYIIEGMLQSPRFIYRIEDQRGDGARRLVGPYELASRMSYIIWGGPPDEELLKAADRGELYDDTVVESQVKRMLADSRAVERSAQFVSEWLNLGRLQNLRPDPEKFPNWDAQLAADMREETLAYFKQVAWKQQRPLADLLHADFTYATPRLAKHYGLKPQGEGLTRYDLSQVPGRGGLLTQGSVLTVGGDEASMVSRGLFVLHDLLRGTVNAPPPCVNTTPPPTKAGLTQRGIAESRIANEQCGVCHARFEPLAFGLEKFDGLGAFHDRDKHGNRLRDDGEILFPGDAKPVQYESCDQLMDLLAGSPRVQETLTWKVAQFAVGRPLVAADAATVNEIHQAAQQGGGTYSSLITAIVLSDLVRKTRTERNE
ncbi:MAG: DUF1592 domain-containing protein [Pirellulaceae bacterium]